MFGDSAGLEWDQENPEYLRLNAVGQPSQTLSRGFGSGMGAEASRFVRMPRGHPETLTDAWANIYTEFAVAIEARLDERTLAPGLLRYPDVVEGARGVRFVEAAAGGTWVDCRLEL